MEQAQLVHSPEMGSDGCLFPMTSLRCTVSLAQSHHGMVVLFFEVIQSTHIGRALQPLQAAVGSMPTFFQCRSNKERLAGVLLTGLQDCRRLLVCCLHSWKESVNLPSWQHFFISSFSLSTLCRIDGAPHLPIAHLPVATIAHHPAHLNCVS